MIFKTNVKPMLNEEFSSKICVKFSWNANKSLFGLTSVNYFTKHKCTYLLYISINCRSRKIAIYLNSGVS